jgi:transposase InsO family protein
MTNDDVLFGYRLRCFTLAGEVGVSAACRQMGIHRSTYYRWRHQVDRYGIDALRVRERRRPRMPNQLGAHVEQRIIAYSLANPGFGPRRISAELARPKWGGLQVSEHGIWRVLRRHGLNTRNQRLALVARYRDRYERKPEDPPPERHIDAERPGQIVGMDCFYVGRLSGTKGPVWQITAIDIASGYAWGGLHVSDAKNPSARHTKRLAHRVARELSQAGWKLEAVITDNGGEFRSKEFSRSLERMGVQHRRIRAGRPTSNGNVERLQRTILEECWRPSFARSLVPKVTALRHDLEDYLTYYNYDRAHTGRLTQGRVPADIVYGAKKMGAVR